MTDTSFRAVTASLTDLLKATTASQQAVKSAAAAGYATAPGQPPAPAGTAAAGAAAVAR